MKMPEIDKDIRLSHHKYTVDSASSIAADIIHNLDEKGYSKDDVQNIAEWTHYLSTQD